MPADRRGDRQAALQRRLADAGLDALLVTHLPNIRYLTGFTGSAAMLVVDRHGAVLLTDPRYAVQAPEEAGTAAEVVIEPVNLWTRLGAILTARRPGGLGFERDHFSVRQAERLDAIGLPRVEPAGGAVDSLRVCKDPDEIEAIRAAAALAIDALEATLPTIRPGQPERSVAARLECELRERGSEWHPFQTIVASGPRSALPHARTGSRTVEKGDLLLLDFGAIVQGYCSDLTRTVVVGAAPDARQQECYDAVRTAQQAAISGLRPGMTGREADAVARDSLARAGLAEAFRHSLGHGLGLEVHEDPRLAPTAEGHLPAGAVVTVEPGVYFEGWGGIRLEDDVALSAHGPTLVSPGAPALRAVP
jgi:Xaa-Pro aminopeptidase